MAWRVEIKNDVDVKYRIWSTVSGSYITEWMSKLEITKFLFWKRVTDFIEEFIEDAMTFPNNYSSLDGNRIFDKDKNLEYSDYRTNAFDDDKLVEEKFTTILNEIGVKLLIEDNQYSVNVN